MCGPDCCYSECAALAAEAAADELEEEEAAAALESTSQNPSAENEGDELPVTGEIRGEDQAESKRNQSGDEAKLDGSEITTTEEDSVVSEK